VKLWQAILVMLPLLAGLIWLWDSVIKPWIFRKMWR
jgi:hypothetical protein